MKEETICELCCQHDKMADIKKMLSGLSKIGIPMFDRAVANVEEAVDVAINTLGHGCRGNCKYCLELEEDEYND